MDVNNDKDVEIKNLKENIENLFWRDYIELLIKSNLELQSKISELIVINTSLMKDLRNLLDILKEAALEKAILKKHKSSSKEKKKDKKQEIQTEKIIKENMDNIGKIIENKFGEINKVNLKMLEILEELNKSIKKSDMTTNTLGINNNRFNTSFNNQNNRMNDSINSTNSFRYYKQ